MSHRQEAPFILFLSPSSLWFGLGEFCYSQFPASSSVPSLLLDPSLEFISAAVFSIFIWPFVLFYNFQIAAEIFFFLLLFISRVEN